MSREWAVSIHDVAPATWPECEQLLELVAPYRVPVSLLVTPHYHHGSRLDTDGTVVTALRDRARAGDEIVLHGYFHRDDGPPPRSLHAFAMRRLWTDREGEFAALDSAAAAWRLAAGMRLLREAGLEPAGFVPPAWLLGSGALRALRTTELRYTCTRDELLRLPDCTRLRAPSLVYSTRSAWRRALSRHWNRNRLARLESQARIRIALHPAEARYPKVRAEWRRLLECVAGARRAVLETAWLDPGPCRTGTVTPETARAGT